MEEFWKNNGETVLVGIITAIVVLILLVPIKALFKKLGKLIETGFESLGLDSRKDIFVLWLKDTNS